MTVVNPRQSTSPTADQIELVSRYKSLPFELAIQKIQARLIWQKDQKRQKEHEKRKQMMIEHDNRKRMAKDKNSDHRLQVHPSKHYSPNPEPSTVSTSRIYQRDSRKNSWKSTATKKEMSLLNVIARSEDRAGPGRRPRRSEEARTHRNRRETRRPEFDRRGAYYDNENRNRARNYRHSRSRSRASNSSHGSQRGRTQSRSPRLDYSRRRTDAHRRHLSRRSSSRHRRSPHHNEFNDRRIRYRSPVRERRHSRGNDGAAVQEFDHGQRQQPLAIRGGAPPLPPQPAEARAMMPYHQRPGVAADFLNELRERNLMCIAPAELLQQPGPNLPPQPPMVQRPYPPHPLGLQIPIDWDRYPQFPPYVPPYPPGIFRGPIMPRGRGRWFPRGGRGGLNY